jgi:hypothetical protein
MSGKLALKKQGFLTVRNRNDEAKADGIRAKD